MFELSFLCYGIHISRTNTCTAATQLCSYCGVASYMELCVASEELVLSGSDQYILYVASMCTAHSTSLCHTLHLLTWAL